MCCIDRLRSPPKEDIRCAAEKRQDDPQQTIRKAIQSHSSYTFYQEKYCFHKAVNGVFPDWYGYMRKSLNRMLHLT